MNEKTIVRMVFGSHLYGCEDETSDKDFKGIFMPTKEQIFLGKIPKVLPTDEPKRKKAEGEKNTADDVDTEIYSLHYFIKLACEGQTVALDMLHAPDAMILESSDIWTAIVANRDKFYTKNLKAFVGYARRQVAKYGIKSSRLSSAKEFVSLLGQHKSNDKLSTIWELLPLDDHCYHLGLNKNNINQYQICGKIFQETTRIGHTLEIMQKFTEQYGKRAIEAAQNKNIDWKSVSHALRAAYQVHELLTENTITFPLRRAPFLKEVKQGKLDYLTEVAPILEALMDEVEILSENSTLPEKPDRKFWDQFIIDAIQNDQWRIQV